MKAQQSGFTLIELVAVIVLLGILAVSAFPTFIDLQVEARESVIEGVEGAMQGYNVQASAKVAIETGVYTGPSIASMAAGVKLQGNNLTSATDTDFYTVYFDNTSSAACKATYSSAGVIDSIVSVC